MVYQEKKTKQGYNYKVEDVFGTIEIDSEQKLDGEILDDMVLLLLRKNLSAETITGEVLHKEGKVTYTFKRAPMWEDDDEKTPCENTHTSTKEQEKESTATYLLNFLKRTASITNWFNRFVEAFLEAWRKAKK